MCYISPLQCGLAQQRRVVILSIFGFCLLLVHPEGRVGTGNDHRLCGQADLGLHFGSVVHYITRESLTRSLFPPLEHGDSPSSCIGL